jgi:hypothetical protein
LGWADFNNDGFDDLYISQPYWDTHYFNTSGFDVGRIYLFKGGNDLISGSITDPESQSNLCITGTKPRALFGRFVITPDINNDGASDILLASPRAAFVSPDATFDQSGVVTLIMSPLSF